MVKAATRLRSDGAFVLPGCSLYLGDQSAGHFLYAAQSAQSGPGFITMGFVRGEQFAEIIVSDRTTRELFFFLVAFQKACNATNSCTNGDLLTPAVESGWTSFTLYDEVDLQNTIVDCLHCHQTQGPGTQKILRMQELQNPWTHFFP